jgi:hypothetical protein
MQTCSQATLTVKGQDGQMKKIKSKSTSKFVVERTKKNHIFAKNVRFLTRSYFMALTGGVVS